MTLSSLLLEKGPIESARSAGEARVAQFCGHQERQLSEQSKANQTDRAALGAKRARNTDAQQVRAWLHPQRPVVMQFVRQARARRFAQLGRFGSHPRRLGSGGLGAQLFVDMHAKFSDAALRKNFALMLSQFCEITQCKVDLAPKTSAASLIALLDDCFHALSDTDHEPPIDELIAIDARIKMLLSLMGGAGIISAQGSANASACALALIQARVGGLYREAGPQALWFDAAKMAQSSESDGLLHQWAGTKLH